MLAMCQFVQSVVGSGLIVESADQEAIAVVILAPEFKNHGNHHWHDGLVAHSSCVIYAMA